MFTSNADRWTLIAWLLALPTVAVLLVVVGGLFLPASDLMPHLRQYVLPKVIPNSIALVTLVVIGATTLGVFCASLVVFFEFPGRRFFSWVLLLPMAFPGYVLAFIYVGMFDYASPLQTFIRGTFNYDLTRLWNTSLPGLTFVLTLALFPYVFLLARSGFASQGRRALEVAYSCQMPPARAFRKAVLPLSWPWIMGGALLVGMETLADFGAVSVFNFDTFTTAIYKTWFSLFSLSGALKLASFLLLFVFFLVVLERYVARRKNRSMTPGGTINRFKLTGSRAWAATVSLLIIFTLAVLLPTTQLLLWCFGGGVGEWQAGYMKLLKNSLMLGISGAALITFAAIFLSYAARLSNGWLTRLASRIAGLGYAMPGTLLAVGIVIPLSALDSWINNTANTLGMGQQVVTLNGVLLATLLAYLVRFGAVALSPIENGLMRVSTSIDNSSRVLGVSGVQMLYKVHWPMLKLSTLTALLLVFVDIMKEMPITLMTRPFGWDTLAVRVFEHTAEGQWPEAAPAALLIVLAGMVPIIFLTRNIERAISHR